MVRGLELQLRPQSFQWIFRTDFLYDGLVRSPCSPRDSHESSPNHSSKALILQCSAFFISFVHFFLSLNNILSYGYTTTLCIHSPIKGHLGCFCFWQLWMKLIETFVCRFLGGHKFSTPLVNTKEDGGLIVSKNIFSFVRNCQTLFQSGCPVFHSYQKRLRNPTASHPHQHLVFLALWILAILIRM